MKSLPTEYGGAYMRSHLEARWAVYLDAIGARWSYERAKILLPTGHHYVPDFWLPDFGLWAEVKPPGGFDSEALLKATVAAVATNTNGVVLLEGTPDFYAYGLILHRPAAAGRMTVLSRCLSELPIYPANPWDGETRSPITFDIAAYPDVAYAARLAQEYKFSGNKLSRVQPYKVAP